MRNTTKTNHSIDSLARAMRLSLDRRTGKGLLLRAESFFNAASYIDEIGATAYYGGKSLHEYSHGETFFKVLELKFQRDDLFLLDEPEAALSPQRQLALFVLIRDVLDKRKDAQFILATHSAVLLGFPDAPVISFDEGKLQKIKYEDTVPMQIVRRFLTSSPS